ncbi:unnamed protein product, partial [Menidia menidia]
ETAAYIINNVGLQISPRSPVDSGTPVSIRCQVSVSSSSISKLTHQFLLTRDDVPIHSSNTTEESVEYALTPARAADSGTYECRVTVKDKSRSSISQKLDVTGLQTPKLSLNNLTPYENEEFVATCSAPEEKGPLKFHFYQRFRTGEPEMIKQLQTAGNSSEATLKIRHIGECFLSCDYEISMVSENRRSNLSDEIQVLIKVLNIVPVMNILPSQVVFEGDTVEVICRVMDSRSEQIEVFLVKDKQILKKSGLALSHRFVVKEGDSGELVCKAEWGNVQKEKNQAITVKELFSKPQLTVEPTELFEGDRFKLTCSVSIYIPERISNETMKFSFYKDNIRMELDDETTKFTTYKNNVQQISVETKIIVVNFKKNGNYTCKAQTSSLTHNFVKESQRRVIQAKVPVSEPVLSVVGGTLFLGKPFRLLCHSERGSLPITYTLQIPNSLPENQVVTKLGEQAIFKLPGILKKSDVEKFLCHAKNSLRRPPQIGSGEQLLRSARIIEPVSKPVLTIQPNSGDVSEGQSVSLVCSVLSGSPPINFTWYHSETVGALASLSTNEMKGTHSIPNLRGEHGGNYYCVSTNLAKETKQSLTVAIGVKMAGWKKGLIAIFCVLLLLVILVIAFKSRLLKFKRKRTGQLSVKSASTKTERLSLTQAEMNEAANVTPGMMGKSVWSEHVSGSDTDDQNSVTIPDKPEPQYTEVQTREADPNRAPVKQGTDTVYSEVRNSVQGVPELTDGASVEYAQLNRDDEQHNDHSNHGDDSVNNDHTTETDNSVSVDVGDQGGETCDSVPDC